ncbi:MAG: hypothetical protein ACI8P3_001710 [Saprospiraceae bacterium]|jgi:hypothetical protein
MKMFIRKILKSYFNLQFLCRQGLKVFPLAIIFFKNKIYNNIL